MKDIAADPEQYLAAACDMLIAEGMNEAAELLKKSAPRFDETGYDNWNGGTAIWTIYLLIDPAEYARLGTKREGLEEQVSARLKPILEQYTSDWFGVKIAPRIAQREDWRSGEGEVSIAIRQNIFDGLRLDSVFGVDDWTKSNFSKDSMTSRTFALSTVASKTPLEISGSIASTTKTGIMTGSIVIRASIFYMGRPTCFFGFYAKWCTPSFDRIGTKHWRSSSSLMTNCAEKAGIWSKKRESQAVRVS